MITADERNLYRDDVPIAGVITHPEYRRALYYHDIGLLRLVRRVKWVVYRFTRIAVTCLNGVLQV